MANKAYKVVIVEGERREVGIFDLINEFFFQKYYQIDCSSRRKKHLYALERIEER